MSTTTPGPGDLTKAVLKLGSVPLEDELADLLGRDLVCIDLGFDPLPDVSCVELRRPRDKALMARLIHATRDEQPCWKFVDLHLDFVAALKREGLLPHEEECLVAPVARSEEFTRGVARALESSLTLAGNEATEKEQPSGDPVSELWDLLRRGTGSISGPADWSLEHDHYLYGTPKRAGSEDEK